MSRHLEHLHFQAKKFSRRRFFNQKVWLGWSDFEFEPEVPEKIRIGDHRRSRWMTTDLTTEPFLYRGNVLDVVDVTVGEKQQFEIDLSRCDPIRRPLWRVE